MKQRVITTAWMLALFIPILFMGKIFLVILTSVLAYIGTFELIRLFGTKNEDLNRYRYTMPIFSAIVPFLTYFEIVYGLTLLVPYIVIIFLVLTSIPVLKHERLAQNSVYLFFAILYGGIAFGLAISNRYLDDGLKKFIYILLSVTMTDMFAYFIGIKWGRHRLAPTISPKKSIEGSIGGTVLGTTIASLYVFLFDVTLFPDVQGALEVILVIVSTILLTIIVQIGDLVASKIKRAYDVKDYGNIFPGHGGVMDRFDSLIFAGLTFYVVHSLITLIQGLL